MTLTQLTYLVAVDTYRHFGRAAAHCCVTQPTLSAQVRKLEDELGIEVFDRSPTPVQPTDLGARVIAQARVVLEEGERLQALVLDAGTTVAGELRLGIIPTLATYLLPLVTDRFAQAYPAVDLVVHEMITEHILDALAADRLDAGLIATAEARPGLQEEVLFVEPFVAYVSTRPVPVGPMVPQDLAAESVWLLSEGHCFRDQVVQFCGGDAEARTSAPIRFESGNLETLRHLVDRVGGMTLLPYLATLYLDAAEQQQVRPFAVPRPHREVRCVHRRAYLKQPLVEAYRETVRAVVQPLLEAAPPTASP